MAMKKWRPKITVQFITEYAKYSCLWDPNNQDYKNKELRIFSLQQISAAMAKLGIRMDVNDVKTKIRILRNTYINELRKIAESKLSSSGKIYKTNLYWFRYADLFLRKVVKIPDLVAQNCDVDSDEGDDIQQQPNRDVIIEFLQPAVDQRPRLEQLEDIESQDHAPLPRTLSPEKKLSIIHAKKRKASHEVDTSEDRAPCFETWRTNGDEFDVFGHSIALQMKQLPLVDALELQVEIQNVVVQKRLKALRKTAEQQSVESTSGSRPSFSVMALSEDDASQRGGDKEE